MKYIFNCFKYCIKYPRCVETYAWVKAPRIHWLRDQKYNKNTFLIDQVLTQQCF